MTAPPVRAVLVDDEPPALKRLRRLLEEVGEVEVVGEFTDPAEALAGVGALRPDLLFLDIQMPGMSGIELARELGEATPLVVFVTAFDEHALRAFEVHAFDYLLKPIDPARLRACLAAVGRRLGASADDPLPARLQALLRTLESGAAAPAVPAPGAPPRVPLRVDGVLHLLAADEIDRVEVEDDYLRVHASDRQLLVRETLGSLEQRLPAGRFVRVHRSHLVNADRVRELRPWFGGDFLLVLRDGTRIVSGRTHRARIREAFGV